MGNRKIQIRAAEKTFTSIKGDNYQALSEISMDIYDGEFVCLLGPSGCGKTTLLNLIAGFETPSSGEVIIDGKAVERPDPRHITLFQNSNLFPWRTVLGNVRYGLEMNGMPGKKRNETALEYIRMVGLERFINNHPHELSGGMQQRAAIARALAVDPDIIFMDEPFGALDAMTRMNMQEEISRIWQERNKTIIFVTHDLNESVYLADRVVVMTPHPGRIKNIISIDMPRPRDRTSREFETIYKSIYNEFYLVDPALSPVATESKV